MPTPNFSRLHAITGSSFRLRDELVATFTATWTGVVKRVTEPSDLSRLILDLDTPSLFEPPALWLVRAGPVYLRQHAALLRPLVDLPLANDLLVLVINGFEAKYEDTKALGKAMSKAGTVQEADTPYGPALIDWLTTRLSAHAQGVDRPRQVAEAMARHLGDDADALLAALDVVAIHAGDQPLSVAAVEAVVGGTAERPIWEFTGGLLDGDAKRAIELFYAGGGEAEPTMAAVASELRKCLACMSASTDAEAAALAGIKGRPNLHYTRQRARALGAAMLARLFAGVYQVQRQLRQTGTDPQLAIELLTLNTQRVLGVRRR